MERREAQHRCRRVAASLLRSKTETRIALRRSNHAADPPAAGAAIAGAANIACEGGIRCGVSGSRIPRKIGAGTEEGFALRGPRNESARSSTLSFRRLSPPLVRSASRRKRHLPVVGEGGSTSASRGAWCVHARAGAALHSTSRTPLEAPLMNEAIGI